MRQLIVAALIGGLYMPLGAGLAQAADTGPAMVGNDRDAHGCIGSAGYSWCESTGKCERPWELAAKQGFDNTHKAFKKYCRAR